MIPAGKFRRAAPLLALIALAGCVKFGANPPARLLAIAAQTRPAAGEPVTAPADSALFIDVPTSSKALATTRVAVRDGGHGWSYVKDALWVDTPARQFQALLGETVTARNGTVVLDPGQYLARQGSLLRGELVDFEVDATARMAIVTYEASLLSADGATIVRERFTASSPLAGIDERSVAPALSAAANMVAEQVADWLKTRKQP